MDAAEKRRRNAEYMREYRKRNPTANADQYARRAASDPDFREAARQRAARWYVDNRERALGAAQARYAARGPREPQPSTTRYKGASYYKLHRWITQQKGAPAKCEHCGTEQAKRYEWANVDHEYRADLADWVRLCKSCHVRHDIAKGFFTVRGRPRKSPD